LTTASSRITKSYAESDQTAGKVNKIAEIYKNDHSIIYCLFLSESKTNVVSRLSVLLASHSLRISISISFGWLVDSLPEKSSLGLLS